MTVKQVGLLLLAIVGPAFIRARPEKLLEVYSGAVHAVATVTVSRDSLVSSKLVIVNTSKERIYIPAVSGCFYFEDTYMVNRGAYYAGLGKSFSEGVFNLEPLEPNVSVTYRYECAISHFSRRVKRAFLSMDYITMANLAKLQKNTQSKPGSQVNAKDYLPLSEHVNVITDW